jgi:seryl-tRNA synthetase
MSTSKALPPAPPELLSAHDRVGNLNARLDNLAHRRNNINRSIKQMTELMPSDNLMASAEVLRKREVERMKVERLREELADVQQEEYDLGLKLHRAYKRLDREAEFEPTGLWVRRVTG